jgi:hypothetical protein
MATKATKATKAKGAKAIPLSRSRSLSAKGVKGKAQAVVINLDSKVAKANKSNKSRRVKPHAEDRGANYLREAIATVSLMSRKGETPARDWYRANPSQCVVIDARKVVVKVKDTLHLRPDNTVRARLASLALIAPDIVGKVGYCRLLVNSSGNPAIAEGNDDAYRVILFRK